MPLTRALAGRRAVQLFDLCAGFVHSQVLLACVRLRWFELVREPRDIAALCEASGLRLQAAERLVEAAIALGLLEHRPRARIGLGRHGAALLGNPAVSRMIEHHALLYDDLRDPVALLRGEGGPTRLAHYWGYAASDHPDRLADDRVAAYSDLMSESQSLVAEDVLRGYPFRRHRRLMDVGGGDGTFLLSAARHAPQLQLQLFDLPAVAARAEARFVDAGIAPRTQVAFGDFRIDRLPAGADVITLIRVVHDHDDDAVMKLLRAVHAALAPGGTVVVAEPMAGSGPAGNATSAYFEMYLLAMGSGRPRRREHLSRLLHAAGFVDVASVRLPRPLQCQMLTARRR